MSITVYGYSTDPGVSAVTAVLAEIALEDGYEVTTSEVYAYDPDHPDLDHILEVLSGDAELGELILKEKRLVATVSEVSA